MLKGSSPLKQLDSISSSTHSAEAVPAPRRLGWTALSVSHFSQISIARCMRFRVDTHVDVCYTIFLRGIHSSIDSHTPHGCLGRAWSV